jgi:hypothetical protein
MQARIEQVLRFERSYVRRLRAASEARHPNQANAAQAGILHELLDGPCTVARLRDQLELDAGYLSRNLRWQALVGYIVISVACKDRRERPARG